ncbi:MAG: DUF5703 domain-containing protein [Verrucomicrobia bacterium]|nr:DUF5703 domain-containing protein [Verrucomicrobiota bacterium]
MKCIAWIGFTVSQLSSAFVLSAVAAAQGAETGNAKAAGKYNVIWTSPSKDYNGSMPIGNGDLAANVWVEPTGDLIFYISKSDTWTGGGPDPELLKLGRVRVRLDKPLFEEGSTFSQELDLKTGSITIHSSLGDQTRDIRFWIDANRPVVHVDIESSAPCTAEIALESWRAEGKYLRGGARKDIILPSDGETVRWYQRNEQSIYKQTMINQHMGGFVDQFHDPLLHRTFGGLISGEGLKSKDEKTLVTAAPAKKIHVSIHALTAQTKTPEDWLAQLEQQRKTVDAVPREKAWPAHVKWWEAFWQRSWIGVTQAVAPAKPIVRSMIPSNDLNFRIGETRNGGEKFQGEVGRVSILSRALSDGEIKTMAGSQAQDVGVKEQDILFSSSGQLYLHIENSDVWTDRPGMTLEAWIKPGDISVPGRILDKTTPGDDAGFLLDTYPGDGLRLIAGDRQFTVPKCLIADQWSHVAVAVDATQERMEIYLNGERIAGQKSEKVKSDFDEAFAVSQAYTLQRWIQACAGRGAYPIKFNGSLFTVDAMDEYWHLPEGRYIGPDYMRWGGPYWFQNTRLIYWPMLYSGDYDQMVPLFTMYRNMLPLLKARAHHYFGHDGVHFSETTQIWGLNRDADFGSDNPDFYPTSGYMKYNWDCGLELSTMLLAYYQHTEDAAFVKETLLPIADQVVTFYEQHYKRDKDGKLHISPSQALETWQTAEDPVPVVAGLRVVLTGLLALPEPLTTSQQRERWKRVLGEVKEIPLADEAGKKWVKPAHVFSNKRNSENAEMYAVFPYPVYGVGKPDLEIGLETYARRENKRTGGWQQDAIQAALLGLTEDAKAFLLQNVTTENLMGGVNEKAKRADSRFPAFWGPNFDWIPDQCNGSVILATLQYMLMQTDGKKILLLPAWPQEWNAEFKLHAPHQTTVEGRVVNGALVDLKVTPESRRKDVVVMTKDAK